MSRAHRLRWPPSSGEPTAGLPTPETEVAGEACIVTDSGVELAGVHPRELFVIGLAPLDHTTDTAVVIFLELRPQS